MKEVVNISNHSKALQGLNLLTKNNDFLLLFLGRLVSNTGSAIFFISILWVTVSKLGGAATVSFILMASAIPSIILSPFAGIWADRWKKKNILVVTDLISGGLLLFLSLFLNVKLFQVWVLFSTVFAIQVCSTIFSPALQSLIPSAVEDRSLSQANALISMTNNLSQLIGMAIGGVLISLVGLRAVILLDGISFILSGISEMFIKAEDKKKEKRKLKGIFPDIKDGLKLIWSKVELKGLISLEAIVDFFGTTIFVF
ncbi:MAG: MFS transporter, partial [Atribacterota bacterium]